MNLIRIKFILMLLLSLKIHFLPAQELSKQEKIDLLQKIQIELKKSYIIESTAIEMATYLDGQTKSGQYEAITNGHEFAFAVTRDLRKVSNDLHLGLMYSETDLEAETELAEAEDIWLKDLLKSNGYGITDKKILEGNIGYLEIPLFGPIEHCADTLFEAMKFIAETDALIIDLRSCRGSLDPDMIPLLCGYFFNEPVHLFNFENREKNTIRQMWSAAYVPGDKYLNKPIYILTSGRTFSGGEELAYDLKHHEKAIIVGQATKGGAQPTYPVHLSKHFLISIPKERSVNTITKTNWEQVGVRPTIEINATIALQKAHQLALEKILDQTVNLHQKENLHATLLSIKSNQPTIKKINIKLDGFLEAKEVYLAGSFNYWAPKANPFIRQKDGWVCEIEVSEGSHGYKIIVDGQWILDPSNPNTMEEDGITNSKLVVKK